MIEFFTLEIIHNAPRGFKFIENEFVIFEAIHELDFQNGNNNDK
jgi:hypothetical protein